MSIRLKLLFSLVYWWIAGSIASPLAGQHPSGGSPAPIPVEIRATEGGFQLYRGGAPYYVKGAGGKRYLHTLKAAGGNSIRTWSLKNAREILDAAHAEGLTVCMGLWVGHERHGFDYDDEAAVAAQLEKFTALIDPIKNHPALLMWGVGNEMDLFYSNHKVWAAVEDIAQMIKSKDTLHPTMVVTAGIDPDEVRMIRAQCPSIDILGVNTYGDVYNVPEKIREYGWEKAYMITEWGPNGHWESPTTAWDVAVEQSSFEKAEVYEDRYENVILADKERCVGSYVFLWGNKQETTATWYGLFLRSGHPTESLDRLTKGWSGSWPANRAPSVKWVEISGQRNGADIYLVSGSEYSARVQAEDPEGNDLKVEWEIFAESTDKHSGGDFEETPEELTDCITRQSGLGVKFRAPTTSGPYRLFVYVYDDSGKVGTVNAPFWVR